MTNREQMIDELVLDAIADDYESCELITKQVGKWRNGKQPELQDVSDALARLIENGYARAYILSPTPPHVTAAEFSQDRLDELWYYTTESGLKLLKEKGPRLNVGCTVRLIGIPDGLVDDLDLPTKSIFQKCLGHVFVIEGFNAVGMAELEITSVTGKVGETIWVESKFLEPIATN